MDFYSIFWLAALIIFLVAEIITLGLTSIWFAGGALVSFIASFLGANLVVQIILFFVVSIVLVAATRPLASKYFNKNRTKTNIDAVVGKRGFVVTEIDNLKGQGEISLAGQVWTARSADNSVIGKDIEVEIVAIEGVKLIVKR